MALAPLPDTAFWRAYQAPAKGLLRWDEADALLVLLAGAGGGWYVFDLHAAPPTTPSDDITATLEAVREMYAPVRDRSYCGTIYVDDPEAPTLVKFFDPYQMGATCGSSGERTLPRYVFSRIKPDPLPEPEPEPKPGFFARLAGLG
ncbi:MAG TPA: hypothetical protein ENK63_03235 [Rhodobacterales bacterium]|nr:hypothetical protein [Rhodobacterales bacterium]